MKLWEILECYGCNFCSVNLVVIEFEDVYLWDVDLFKVNLRGIELKGVRL